MRWVVNNWAIDWSLYHKWTFLNEQGQCHAWMNALLYNITAEYYYISKWYVRCRFIVWNQPKLISRLHNYYLSDHWKRHHFYKFKDSKIHHNFWKSAQSLDSNPLNSSPPAYYLGHGIHGCHLVYTHTQDSIKLWNEYWIECYIDIIFAGFVESL